MPNNKLIEQTPQEREMSQALKNPLIEPCVALARMVADAQVILSAASEWTGPSKADTIKALNDLLRGPAANAALVAAEREVQS